MSVQVKYWLRVAGVGIIATALNAVADLMLGVRVGSGRDWLIYLTLLGLGMYFFVYQWGKRVGYPKEKSHEQE